jgi:hypothetical protein
MRAALVETPDADAALFGRVEALGRALDVLQMRLFGDNIRGRLNEPGEPSIAGRIGRVYSSSISTRQLPTQTQRESLALGRTGLEEFSADLAGFLNGELAGLGTDLEAAGAPHTPGRRGP